MPRIASFNPIASESARILILGSMPGVMSLAAKQYYAHPRNSFWKIMSAILGFPETAAYEQRIAALKHAGIALWDVLHSCVREGSLDADIEAGSAKANNIQALLRRHPGIEIVCFNGAVAETCYKRLIVPTLKNAHPKYMRLPSTSPAHAALSFEQKVAAWRAAIFAQRVQREGLKQFLEISCQEPSPACISAAYRSAG
jgi:double-stranded uracil-DNA glycosylase